MTQDHKTEDSVRKDIALFCYTYVLKQFGAIINGPYYKIEDSKLEGFSDRVSKSVESDIVVRRGTVGKGYEKEEILKHTNLAAKYCKDIADNLVGFFLY